MLKPVKFALIVVGLCAGFLLTAFAAVSGLAMLSPRCYGRDTRLMKAKQQVAGARAAVQTFVMDWGRCPAGVYELVTAGHLERIERDPWGQELFFSCADDGEGFADVSVFSAGPDRVFWSADDIKSGELPR